MKILFVCTGNTCRSYMAEMLMKDKIKKAVAEDIIPKGAIKVKSAGLFVVEGDEASEQAVDVLENEFGIDADKHSAKQITGELMEDSDIILTMTDGHKHALQNAYPDFEDKITTLIEYAYDDEINGVVDIEDPYRGDRSDYIESAVSINNAINAMFPKLIKEYEEDVEK